MTSFELDLARGYDACGRIVKSRARNFWYGLRLTPEPKRSALYAIYAWMREADDIADEEGATLDVRRLDLDAFRVRTHRIFLGETDPDPRWRAFGDTVQRYALPRAPFDAMIDGQDADLDWTTCADRPVLERFCWQVASTVGLICVRIWGHDGDPDVERMAVDRGKAFQLTNVIRDLREDHGRMRTYLPADELEAAGLDLDALISWRDAARCDDFVRGQVAHAEAYFRASAGLDAHLSEECRATSWAMTRIYHELLRRIERDPSRIVRERVGLGSIRKMAIAWRARRYARGVAS
jgi:phytoene synthase